jgi:hypothetical protein
VKFVIFADDEAQPSWILRCHHDWAVAAREVLVLSELQHRGYRLQPELVACDSCEDMHAQLLRFCEDQHRTIDAWRRPDVIDRLSTALAGVHVGLSTWAPSRFDSLSPRTADLCAAVQRAGGATTNEMQLVRTLERSRDEFVRAHVPGLPQHGDVCLANLLWSDGDIRLLDWEHFGLSFEPFLDIWMFGLSLCEDSGDLEAASLFTASANATAVERAVRRYATDTHLTVAIGRQAFPLAMAGSILINGRLGRIDAARRLCRILDRYLVDPSSFMRALRP